MKKSRIFLYSPKTVIGNSYTQIIKKNFTQLKQNF